MSYEITFTLPDNEALESLRSWQAEFRDVGSIRPGLRPLLTVQLPAPRSEIKVGDRIVVYYDSDPDPATTPGGEIVVAVTEDRVYTAWFEDWAVHNDDYAFNGHYTFEVAQ